MTKVSHISNNGIAHLLPVVLNNNPFVALFLVEIKVQVFDEIFGQIVTQERDIILDLTYFEELLAPHTRLASKFLLLFLRRIIPAFLDIFEDLIPDIIRIEG